ncbi:MAG: PEP-CTERM sorting domain-containing protein [Aulosira sp. DedQUE10]|nr:PEP-CTERM sorting domain-containing protein [Aulosira sp. DedQUE10]
MYKKFSFSILLIFASSFAVNFPIARASALGTSTLLNSNAQTSTVQSTTQHVNNLTVGQGVNNTLSGTTNTNALNQAGATTDINTIHAGVSDPTQNPSSVSPVVQNTGGGTTLNVTGDNNSINTHLTSDEHLNVGNVATVDICLDANATLGGSPASSVANCATKSQKVEVPEPTTIGGLILLGGYFFFRRRQVAKV